MIHRAILFFLFVAFIHLKGFAQSSISFQEIAAVNRPVAITHAGDGSGRLFITLQHGEIVVHDGTQVLATPFLNVSGLLPSSCGTQGNCGERGLLSVAFHPNYESNGFFYVFYTNTNGDLVIARYSISGNPNVANSNSALILKTIPHATHANHNGGQLQFGPDGYLYASTGDGGSGGDPDENGQNPGTLLGKILRLDVNIPSPYIPPGNPFGNEVWAYGLRNPWRFSFDRVTGDLFIGDVGQGCYEEVSFQSASSNGGLNYGWDEMEGRKCYDEIGGGSDCNKPPSCLQFVLPIIAYSHSGSNHCAVTGGYRYRGSLYPNLGGLYIYGDYCSGIIWGATESGGVWTATELISSGFAISTFGEDESGELYVADRAAGKIYLITAASELPFTDDFEDGDISNWNQKNGNWGVNSGNLEGSTTKKASIFAPLSGCSNCTLEADLRVVTPGGRVSLLGWYTNKSSYVELLLKEDVDKLILKQRVNGLTNKMKVDQVLDAGVDYHVKITYDGNQFQVFFNGGAAPILTLQSEGLSTGTVGFRVKSTTKSDTIGSFALIEAY